MKRSVVCGLFVMLVYFGATSSSGQTTASLVNGDFESGDFTGWTSYTTPEGVLGENFQVTLFDTNNDGNETFGATFQVGSESTVPSEPVGGGLLQDVELNTGTLFIEAEVASTNKLGCCLNPDGGLWEILLDGVVVASYDFDMIDVDAAEFGVLSAEVQVTAGVHTLAFQITRQAISSSWSPLDYIDNIQLFGSATILASDADNDGVTDDDLCPDTVIPESVPTVSLGVNRWALTDGDGVFDTTLSPGQGPGLSYTIEDTAGCSCEQIIAKLGLDKGHERFGCSISTMDAWIALVNP